MNSEFYETETPALSKEDAIAILNTPDEELDALIDCAKSLRYQYKGNRVSIHILTTPAAETVPRIALTAHSHVALPQILINTNG